MPGLNSRALFGVQCRKRPRWCRELKSGSIFYEHGVNADGPMSRSNKRKSSLYRTRISGVVWAVHVLPDKLWTITDSENQIAPWPPSCCSKSIKLNYFQAYPNADP